MKNFNSNRSKERFGGGFAKKETKMYKAVCSNCGKTCEVPFKPVNGKPVYCSDCFEQMGGIEGASERTGGDRNRDDRNSRSPRREFKKFNDRPSRFEKSRFNDKPFERAPERTSDLKQQLELLNTKLDKLISIVERLSK